MTDLGSELGHKTAEIRADAEAKRYVRLRFLRLAKVLDGLPFSAMEGFSLGVAISQANYLRERGNEEAALKAERPVRMRIRELRAAQRAERRRKARAVPRRVAGAGTRPLTHEEMLWRVQSTAVRILERLEGGKWVAVSPADLDGSTVESASSCSVGAEA